MTRPLFEIDGLAVDVPGRRLIDKLTLTLPEGSMTALIGHNGSGKSTLLKVLARQIRPAAGTVRFGGRPLADWPGRELARELAFLPQYTPAAEGMLVHELVALGRYPWHGALGRPGPADHAAIEEAIEVCALGPITDRLVDTLSGGERQRAWLAMMIAQGARCLLLDEPISALDIAHQIDVLALVRRLCEEQGRSVVVVLHEVNMSARFCDHVVAMREGAVCLEGGPADLMTPEALARVYGLPMQVLSRPDGAPVAIPA
ncbi:MAG: iron ABC transporter substrate-binding protein [Rhodovulum sulfidophilum]|uniref:Iron ABC transporter substrate-binding protein n=1 Tax=Rhodovulum sulfidophilum TaxID=35806 RepID=A0A2W5N1R0_RHOSU|nr:MAG: iron ABC transporter substrate-binding protein [Rhodovulum sulfidophilum]